MTMQMRGTSARLNHATIGGKVTFEHGQRAFGINRIIDWANHVVVIHACPRNIFTKCLASDGQYIKVQMLGDTRHQAR